MSEINIKSSIRKKLVNGFTFVIIFSLLYFVISYLLINKSQNLVDQTINKQFNASIFISNLAIDGQKLRRYEKEYFIYVDNETKRIKYYNEWSNAKTSLQKRLENALAAGKDSPWDAYDKAHFRSWLDSLNTYASGFESVAFGVASGKLTNTIDANIAIYDAKNAFRVFLSGTSMLGKKKYTMAKESANEIKENFAFIDIASLVTAVIGLFILLTILKRVLSSITLPISALTLSADAMSKGKLDEQLPQPEIQEFQALFAGLERLRVSQKTMLERLMNK